MFLLPISKFSQVCKRVRFPTIVSMVGNIMMAFAFILIGPAPFLGKMVPNSIALSDLVALLIGVGYALVMVSRQVRHCGKYIL